MTIGGRRVVLVTGGGRGFGRAIARRFAREGAMVAVASRTRSELDETVRLIEDAGGTGFAVTGDSRSGDDVRHVVAETEAALGPIQILINNAGVPGPFGPMWEVDPDAWWSAQEVHVRGPFLFMRAVLPGMVARRSGTVITVAAKGGHMVAPNMSAYCTGKASQLRMTRLLAAEGEPFNVKAFAIDPGFVVTKLAEDTMHSPDVAKWLPGMLDRLRERQADASSRDDLDRCANRCLDLASGRYDALSGGYYELPDDLDEALAALRHV